MPGISFICDLKSNLIQKESIILQALDSMVHNEQYERKILLKEKYYILGCTGYNEYPISSFISDDFHIYLEGRIYGMDDSSINVELNYLANRIFGAHVEAREQVSQWLLNTDGDFIVFILHKKLNEIAIVNDALGRLPLYYYKTDGKLIVSRELRFISKLLNNSEFDRMAIAQYLLFGYPLGRRTLMTNTDRLEPATFIKISIGKSEIKIHNVHRFNFETKKYRNTSIDKNASVLVELLCKACKDRAGSINKNLLALSGGLDSRSIGACLNKHKIPFFGVTFLDFDKIFNLDVKVARQLADVYNIDLKVSRLSPPKGRDLLRLLKIKNGLNYLGMSFILPFFDEVTEAHGSRVTWFTGDGGDKVLTDLGPSKTIKHIDDLSSYIISKNQIFSLENVASLTQIQKREMTDELKNHFLSYPEDEWNLKYVHYLIYERAFKWLFEGEDRNRCYFWSVAPFYSIQFFIHAMNCPDEQKTKYALYREFLLKLSPQATAIDNANWQLPITSKKFKTMLLIRSIFHNFPTKIKKSVKSVVKKSGSYENGSNFVTCLREQINNSSSVCNYLSASAIENIANNCSKYSKREIDNLFTITSCIEELKSGKSTIEKYYESDFV